MIRALYLRALALGIAGTIPAGLALANAAWLAAFSPGWTTVLSFGLCVILGFFCVIFVVRARPNVEVTSHGVQQIGVGGWQLLWTQIQQIQMSPSELVIHPLPAATSSQSVRTAAWWSRFFAAGHFPSGAIVLPRARIDSAAAAILQDKNVVVPLDPQ